MGACGTPVVNLGARTLILIMSSIINILIPNIILSADISDH